MFFFSVLQNYLVWHYSQALVGYIRVFRNLWWFLVQFFSLPELFSSLFSPYKRIVESRTVGFNLEAWAGVIIINIMSRLIGLLVRTIIIVVGISTLTIFTFVGLFSYALWIGAPLVITGSILSGIYLWW